MKKSATPRTPKPLTFGSDDCLIPQTGRHAGLAPADALEQGLYGFVYQVTLHYPSGNFGDECYIGQRSFGRAGWQTYTTSSEDVSGRILRSQKAGGVEIYYEILGYVVNKGQASAVEASYILAAKKHYGSKCLNRAMPDGGKIIKRNKYSKRKAGNTSNLRITG